MMRNVDGQDGTERGAPGALDLAALGRVVWARRLWIAVPSLLALAGSLAYVNLATPTYRSEARLLVESGESAYTRSELERAGAGDRSAFDQEAVASQVQIVLSRDVARAVAGQLDLARRPEFDPALRGVNPVKQMLILAGFAENPLRMTAEERVLRSYYDRLTAFQVDRSRIIAIQFESADPQFAAEAANAIAGRFIEAQQANKRSQTRSATEWLSAEIDQLRRKVEDAEGRVESFRARANLFIGSNNVSLTAQQLAEINSQIASARAQQADAQTRARLLRDFLRSGRPIEAGDVVNSELIRRLSEQRATVAAQFAQQSSTLGPRHPRIAELRAQIANLDAQLRAEAEKLVRVLENDARLAGARVESLQQNLDQAKQQASQASEQEVQLRVLEREAKSMRDQLEALLARYRDATSRDSLSALPADARIVSRATVSSVPVSPKKLPTVLIATLGTFLLAVGCVTTAALMGAGGQAPSREEEGGEPILAEAPAIAPEAEAFVPEPAERPAAGPQTIAALADLVSPAEGAARRTLLVATESGLVAAGVALALGRRLAEAGGRVVMVDADGRNAALSSLLEPGARGLADLAAGAVAFPEIIHRDPLSRAHVIPFGAVGASRPSVADLAFAAEALARIYDSVLVLVGELADLPAEDFRPVAGDAVIVAETSADDPTVQEAYSAFEAMGMRPVIVLVAEPAERAEAA